MKVAVYSYRDFDEAEWFEKYSKELGIELVICKDAPVYGENLDLAKGCDAISILTTVIPENSVKQLKEFGVKYISTRTIGYNHIDISAAKKYGIAAGNATYDPDGVADYTIMMMLMTIRKIKAITRRAAAQDFTLNGIQGKEIRDFKIGVVGIGRIGAAVIKRLSGFGCEIIAYDVYQREDLKDIVKYVSFDELLKESDMITLHAPFLEENFHLINEETISKIKDGVVIINTARGELIDTHALVKAIKTGKVSAAGLDVCEHEFHMYYNDLRNEIIDNPDLAQLKSFPNVIVTPHMAFYTENAINSMVKNSLLSIKAHIEGKENPWRVV